MPRQWRIQCPSDVQRHEPGEIGGKTLSLDDVDRQDFLKTLAEASTRSPISPPI
jgi:hypothetical protein